MARKKKHRRKRPKAECGTAAEAVCAVLCVVATLLIVLGSLGYLTPSKSSSGPPSNLPFYEDPNVLSWWFPLETNYIDQTQHSVISLTNVSAALASPACLPRFVNNSWLNPCAGVGQGLLISPSSLSVPFAFSAVIVNGSSGAVLGSLVNGTGLTHDNSVDISPTQITVVQAGTLSYGANYAFGGWTHLVVSINSTVCSIYLNGTLKTTAATYLFPAPAPGVPLILGNDLNSNGDNTFVGQISQARLFARALNATEVAELFTVDL